MKTSNILLTGFLGLVLIAIAASIITAKLELGSMGTIKLSGKMVSETRQMLPFQKIDVSNHILVNFTQDSVQSVEVKADSSLLSVLKTEVRDGVLYLSANQSAFNQPLIEVDVTVALLDAVTVSSGSKFVTKGTIRMPHFVMNANSGATAEMYCEVSDMQVDIHSGSVVNLKGQCTKLTTTCHSGSILGADELVVQNANVTSHSGAILNINVIGEVDVDAHSGSIINCKGNPRTNHMSISSGAIFNK